MHVPPLEENVANDPVDPSEAARARRQRLLRRAMENMGALAPPAQVGVVPVDSSTDGPISAAEPAANLSPQEMQLVAALERKFHEVESGADYFVVLGVTPKASTDEVKAAFLELAKVFHPDRLPESAAHLAAKMRAVFEAVREAYDVLQSDARRASYQASLPTEKDSQSVAKPGEEARICVRRGDALLRKRDFAGAQREYHQAYLLEPNAAYLAAEAWALYSDPARKEEAARAKQMIADAIKKDPHCDRAHYQLGVLARVEGDLARAEKHFAQAVDANPKHFEAAQELRLLRLRRKKGKR